MSQARPLIGITPGFDYESTKLFIKRGYCEAVNQSGGLAVLLPVTEDSNVLDQAMERCDGFILSGGPDIDAKYFGEANLNYTCEISPYRDFMEVHIAKKAVEKNKSILGICRGVQILNVALGGSIYQDIYAQVKGTDLLKHSQHAPAWYPTHDIIIEKNTKMWGITGKECIRVNTFHHQAIRDVAPGFIVTSKATDGIIESIEHVHHKFAVGIQWHAELMWQNQAEQLKLFESFVSSCC